jgi:hypothetical protein
VSYLTVIGRACHDTVLRADLFARGAQAALDRGYPNLSDDDLFHLNDFKEATANQKQAAADGFAQAHAGLVAACKNPPCPYMS